MYIKKRILISGPEFIAGGNGRGRKLNSSANFAMTLLSKILPTDNFFSVCAVAAFINKHWTTKLLLTAAVIIHICCLQLEAV